jgi:hypothetical protein
MAATTRQSRKSESQRRDWLLTWGAATGLTRPGLELCLRRGPFSSTSWTRPGDPLIKNSSRPVRRVSSCTESTGKARVSSLSQYALHAQYVEFRRVGTAPSNVGRLGRLSDRRSDPLRRHRAALRVDRRPSAWEAAETLRSDAYLRLPRCRRVHIAAQGGPTAPGGPRQPSGRT